MLSIACDNWHLDADGNGDFQTLSGRVALVVDDNTDSLLLTSLILEEYEVQVMTATSASEALEVIRQFKPDFLISDIAMPGEDGYSLIRKIRTLPPLQGGLIPAVALTAYARDEECSFALESGFQIYFAKPVEPTELVTAVAKLLVGDRSNKVMAQ